MKKLVLFLLLCSSISLIGQNHFIGFKGGLNWSNATSKFIEQTYRSGFSGGLTYEVRLVKHLLLGADLLYEQKGFNSEILFTDEEGKPFGGTGPTRFNYNYISLPLKAGFIFGSRLAGFINLGVVPAVNIGAEIVLSDNSLSYDVSEHITKFDLGGLVEVGGNFLVTKRLAISSGLTFQHSLTTLSNPDFFNGDDQRNYSFTLWLGLKYALSKK